MIQPRSTAKLRFGIAPDGSPFLVWGALGSAVPAIYQNGLVLRLRNSDDTANAHLETGELLIRAGAAFGELVDNGNSGAAKTIDWTAGNNQRLTLTDNCVLTFTPPAGPAHLTLDLYQDGSGSHSVVWPAGLQWSGGSPVLTTTGGARDLVSLYYDGSSYAGAVLLDVQ